MDSIDKRKPEEFDILVMQRGREVCSFSCPADSSLLEAMRAQGIRLSAACGGSAFCGKCRIRLLEGTLISERQDGKLFTDEEIRQGWYLACRTYPSDNCVIELASDEADFEIVTDYRMAKSSRTGLKSEGSRAANMTVKDPESEYAIAIDIGTSTLVMSLLDIRDGKVLQTYSAANPQRTYGADVISRIQAANNGKGKQLQELILSELMQGICDIVEKAGVSAGSICRLAIACNTVMGHLLLGYSCEGLGRYPYTPVNISAVELPFSQLFNSAFLHAPVTILPGISAFVGGDIVAGLLACDFDKAVRPCLFIDLGTNGELALGNKERILLSSSAAGPAFEGGNISCGCGSVAGAICSVEIDRSKTSFQTIGDKRAVGLCGTGIIELVSELLDEGIIDETGLLEDKYFKEGFPIIEEKDGRGLYFTQRDIRQLQMAKAAIRAGIDILLKEYGISYDEIDKLYLAGGFGFKLNLQKAVNIGLLPKELYGRICPVGNSALSGAVLYLTQKDASARMSAIIKAASELALAEHEDFNSLYPEYMYFS